MLFVTTTHQPATDLGYLLHKNPSRIYSGELTFGKVYVVYTRASVERTTAAVLLDVNSVSLVRRRREMHGSLSQYVNDQPYVASSFLSVAIAEAFGTAMSGRSKERQELAETRIPLELRIPILPSRSGEDRLRRLFEPLGYDLEVQPHPLDDKFPEWGESRLFDVTLRGCLTVRDALRHLYLLLPVLDARKHYYFDRSEVQKLVSKGEGWLGTHPEKDWIVRSSLGRKPSLVSEALEQLANVEEVLSAEMEDAEEALLPDPVEPEPQRQSLHTERHRRVVELVKEHSPRSLIDLGCGDGKLIRQLVPIRGLERIVGMDVSYFELEKAHRKLHLEDAGPRRRERIQLIHGSLMYKDERLRGFDMCTVIEVIEHLDIPRLRAFEKVLFHYARPKVAIVTTPNREYNELYGLEELRHGDHRFEWTRLEFADWAQGVAEKHGYTVGFEGIGAEHEQFGHASQMAVFAR